MTQLPAPLPQPTNASSCAHCGGPDDHGRDCLPASQGGTQPDLFSAAPTRDEAFLMAYLHRPTRLAEYQEAFLANAAPQADGLGIRLPRTVGHATPIHDPLASVETHNPLEVLEHHPDDSPLRRGVLAWIRGAVEARVGRPCRCGPYSAHVPTVVFGIHRAAAHDWVVDQRLNPRCPLIVLASERERDHRQLRGIQGRHHGGEWSLVIASPARHPDFDAIAATGLPVYFDPSEWGGAGAWRAIKDLPHPLQPSPSMHRYFAVRRPGRRGLRPTEVFLDDLPIQEHLTELPPDIQAVPPAGFIYDDPAEGRTLDDLFDDIDAVLDDIRRG